LSALFSYSLRKIEVHILIKKSFHLYAHLREKPDIQDGIPIEQGSVITVSGETATGKEPHLHYEVKYGNENTLYNDMEFINPENLLYAEYDSNGELIKNCN
jgi:murein DD-endopeptidase MepM/ murein hydrolase activator NlpD